MEVLLDSRLDQIVSLVSRYAMPAIYERRQAASANGLMNYEASPTEAYHQAGIYTGPILARTCR